jgi:transposase
MGKPYSQDLRDRVVEAVERNGMSCRGAGRRFGVGDSTAIRWVERYRQTGSSAPGKMGGHRHPVLAAHRDFLLAVRTEQPDITLDAMCRRILAERNVKTDTGTMSRFLRREGITLKKRRSMPPNRSART